MFFNILASRLYMVFTRILEDQGARFALTADVNIARPSSAFGNIVVQLPALAMYGACLETQAARNRI